MLTFAQALSCGVCLLLVGTERPPAIDFSFRSSEGHEFDARIELPPLAKQASHGILLLGGGFGNDLDWSVPGRYTLSGEPTRDGKRLAEFLAERGYVVMRWSTIRHGDPRRVADPEGFTPYPYPELLGHAKSALAAFRDRKIVASDRILLIGHSLGALRACHLLDQDIKIPGLILLAGASLGPTGFSDRELRRQAGALMGEMDRSGNGKCSADEFASWTAQGTDLSFAKLGFKALDRDGDGAIMRWEVASQLALEKRAGKDFVRGQPFKNHMLPWAEDVIARRNVPVLDLCGGLDTVSIYGVLLQQYARERNLENVTVRFLPGLGHNLGRERDDRTDPIDDRALKAVEEWLLRYFPTDPPGK